MTQRMEIDSSFAGIFKTISYLFFIAYTWLESKGINAYVFYVLIFFMVLDIATGVWKSNVVKGLENPSSKIAKKGIITKVVMFTIPVVCGLIWGIFDKENALNVVNTMLVALVLAEGFSIIGNSYTIYTREVLTEYDAVTFLFKAVGNAIKALLEKTLKNLE